MPLLPESKAIKENSTHAVAGARQPQNHVADGAGAFRFAGKNSLFKLGRGTARKPGAQLRLRQIHLFHKYFLPVWILFFAGRNGNGPRRCSVKFPAARRFPRTCSRARFSAQWLRAVQPAIPPDAAWPRVLPAFRTMFFQTSAAIPIRASAAAKVSGDGSARGSGNCERNNAPASPAVPPSAPTPQKSPAKHLPPRRGSSPARGHKGSIPPPSRRKTSRTSVVHRFYSRFQLIDTAPAEFV